jgi:GrpB-like predicted nucleotidyltransferase (UPF0157 family)
MSFDMDKSTETVSPMLAPFKVELRPHDPAWADAANAEGRLLQSVVGPTLLVVHHVGSTAIGGISAKPILDLIPVATNLVDLDTHRALFESLGYAWLGELGLPGRRYCKKDDAKASRRLVQLHCYAAGSPEIDRHLVFRDYLRAHRQLALQYESVKIHCRALHGNDHNDYGDCKSGWIKDTELKALEWWTRGKDSSAGM